MHRSSASAQRGALAIALAGSLVAPLGAQVSGTAQTFGETLDVRVVNIEAVVVDKSGNRVSGLQPSDFRLRVDGKDVPIEYFTEVRGGDAVAPGPAPAGEQAAAGMPALVPGSPVGTSYLVFIDDFFSLARDRDRTLDMIAKDLPRLTPEDRMAVVAYDGRKLDMLSTWSQSVPTLERVLERAKERPAGGLKRAAELKSADRDRQLRGNPDRTLGSLGFRAVTPELDITDRAYAEDLAAQVGGAVEAASATLRSFAAPPGRKVLLLLAGGWPYDPAQYTVNDYTTLVNEPSIPTGEKLLRPLTDTANLLGYTVYPVDVPGMQSKVVDAEDMSYNDAATSLLNATSRESEGETSLMYVADQTGGRALLNGLRDKAFERAVEDTRSYYWLGFTPQHKGDDHHYDVRLEVLKKGLRIRSRQGFQDLSKKTEVSMQVESALLFGNPPTMQPLTVELGKPQRGGRGTIKLPMTVRIPLDRVTMIPNGDQNVADLELRVAALDENGRRSEVSVLPIRIAGRGHAAPGQTSKYDTTMELRKVKQSLVVALYDKTSGELLSSTLEVAP
jgi:VWFA-related protein